MVPEIYFNSTENFFYSQIEELKNRINYFEIWHNSINLCTLSLSDRIDEFRKNTSQQNSLNDAVKRDLHRIFDKQLQVRMVLGEHISQVKKSHAKINLRLSNLEKQILNISERLEKLSLD